MRKVTATTIYYLSFTLISPSGKYSFPLKIFLYPGLERNKLSNAFFSKRLQFFRLTSVCTLYCQVSEYFSRSSQSF